MGKYTCNYNNKITQVYTYTCIYILHNYIKVHVLLLQYGSFLCLMLFTMLYFFKTGGLYNESKYRLSPMMTFG